MSTITDIARQIPTHVEATVEVECFSKMAP